MAMRAQAYELSFDPIKGFFHLEGVGGAPTPDRLQIIVTEPNSSVTITCMGELFFEATPVSWMLGNTLQDATFTLLDTSSVRLDFPTPPQRWDRIGFTLKTRFTSGPKQIALRPELFVTAEKLEPAQGAFELVYTPADGSFKLQHSLQDSIMDAEVVTRLGVGELDNQGGPFQVMLVTAAPGERATFATPAVKFTNGREENAFGNDPVLRLTIPFNSNAGVGMNFIIQYAGVTIHSPDPIIVDKTIGTNPGPGF